MIELSKKQQRLAIEFGKNTSEKDIEDLKILLEDIRERYKFRWFII